MLYLYNVGVPPFAYSELLANIGSMRNDGAEISIGFTPLRTADMELNINANLTFQRNKLLSLSSTYEGQGISAPITRVSPAWTVRDSTADTITSSIRSWDSLSVYSICRTAPVWNPTEPEDIPTMWLTSAATASIWKMARIAMSLDRPFRNGCWVRTSVSCYKRVDIAVQMNGAFGHKIYNGTSLT